jgi:hypothetical protein
MTRREIDAIFERLGQASDVDLVTMSSDAPESPELRDARAAAEGVIRERDPQALADATDRLRAWATDAGSFPPAGVAAQPMNIGQLELRARALPAIHGAILASLAGDAIEPEQSALLLGPWSRHDPD